MASTTRGSIKISTANGIGAALVDVLGGEGYKPDEWEQNINICGIHAADIESALENIEEDAGTGTERGSILLSTANAIGATLNKKFNTSRGFSPREWASAASKLEPLPERTASGAIAHIEDGADGVPIKNWLVTLPASLDGYTEVNGYAEYGTSFTEYIPADTKQYTASLGRTIYGGTADIITGEGEDENGNAFTFTPITPTPETALGVNNFWADEGDSDVTYRKDLDIPDPEPEPGNLLGINNESNNENEDESEG